MNTHIACLLLFSSSLWAACPDWPEPAEMVLQVVELLASPGTEPVVRFDRRQARSRPSPSPEPSYENSP